MSDEQQSQSTTTTMQAAPTSGCPHPKAVGNRWGDSISPERQAELQGYLERWQAETDHGERKGPFDEEPGADRGVPLNGADVSWLAEQSGRDEAGQVPNLHLETLYVNTPLEAGRYIQRSTGVGRLEA